MDEDVKRELKEIIGGMSCPKDFRCYAGGLTVLCKAEDVGLESFLKCLEDNPRDCPFSLDYGGSHFCKCPLRVYIKKKLGR
jgi:hypothetical protein